MKERIINRRFSYLSHVIDATSHSVSRAVKIAAFWASMSSSAVFINLVIYLEAGHISVSALLMLHFLFWCSVFGVLMFTSLSWQAYVLDRVMWGVEDESDNDASPYPTAIDVHRVYNVTGNSAKLVSDTSKASGVGGKV